MKLGVNKKHHAEVLVVRAIVGPSTKDEPVTVSIGLECASRYVHGFNLVCGTFAHHRGRRFSLFITGQLFSTGLPGGGGGGRDSRAPTCMHGRSRLCKQKDSEVM